MGPSSRRPRCGPPESPSGSAFGINWKCAGVRVRKGGFGQGPGGRPLGSPGAPSLVAPFGRGRVPRAGAGRSLGQTAPSLRWGPPGGGLGARVASERASVDAVAQSPLEAATWAPSEESAIREVRPPSLPPRHPVDGLRARWPGKRWRPRGSVRVAAETSRVALPSAGSELRRLRCKSGRSQRDTAPHRGCKSNGSASSWRLISRVGRSAHGPAAARLGPCAA